MLFKRKLKKCSGTSKPPYFIINVTLNSMGKGYQGWDGTRLSGILENSTQYRNFAAAKIAKSKAYDWKKWTSKGGSLKIMSKTYLKKLFPRF